MVHIFRPRYRYANSQKNLLRRTYLTQSSPYIPHYIEIPWTKQPPQPVPRFDQKNFFGKHCFFAMVPGWSSHYLSEVGGSAKIQSYGAVNRVFTYFNEGGNGLSYTRTQNYGKNVGTARTLTLDHSGIDQYYGFRHIKSATDYGIVPPGGTGGEICIVAIGRPIGDGRGNTAVDPRIFSQDLGGAEADHDLMVGIANTGNSARSRVRVNGIVHTTLSTASIQDDTLAIWGGGVYGVNSSAYKGFIAYFAENGTYSWDGFSGSTQASGYAPRTTTDIAIGLNAGVSDNSFEGDIIAIFAFDISLQQQWQYEELLRNPWQIFEPQRISVYYKYRVPDRSVPTAPPTGPATVVGTITFAITTDKDWQNTGTLQRSTDFDITVDQTEANTIVGSRTTDFDITVDQTETNAIVGSRTTDFDITVDQAETNQADMQRTADFDITVDQTEANQADMQRTINFTAQLDTNFINQLVSNPNVSFDITLDFDPTTDNIVTGTINFDITVDEDAVNQMNGAKSMQFTTTLDQNLVNQLVTAGAISFDSNLFFEVASQLDGTKNVSYTIEFDKSLVNTKDTQESVNLDIINDLTLENTKDTSEFVTYNIDLLFDLLNQLNANQNITFSADYDFNAVNNLVGNRTISFDTSLDLAYEVSGAGIVEASIAFLVNQAQEQFALKTTTESTTFNIQLDQQQTNTITISKALDLIMNLADSYDANVDRLAVLELLTNVAIAQTTGAFVPADLTFEIQLSQEQINLATRVALMTFNAALEQGITTQVNYNLFINLATTLQQYVSTGNILLESLNFDIVTDQQILNTKDATEAINLALSTDLDTEIHLTAKGTIELTTELDKLINNQLNGTSSITFGQLLGLASIGSADLGVDISFDTIQNIQFDTFLVEFDIVTPKSRTLKVTIEDRMIKVRR